MKNENGALGYRSWRRELVDFINEKAQEYKDVTINYRSPTMEMMCAVVSECDAMREELEGIGLSDAQVSIVELAFTRGVAVGNLMKENK